MTARNILDYWFGELKDGWVTTDRHALWFGSRAEDDADMRAKFGDMIRQVLDGELESWRETPEGLMAYILLSDQMTRAIFRGTAEAFSGDKLALSACLSAMESGMDLQLPPAHSRFFYLPLEHSEDMENQARCVSAFEEMQTRFPSRREEFVASVHYAREHLEIIRQFGRFPHRNAILNRESSAEERRFLEEGGPTFGQSAAAREESQN